MRRTYNRLEQTLAIEMEYYNKINGLYEPLAEADYENILACLPEVPLSLAILEVGSGSGAFGQRLQRRLASRLNVGLDIAVGLLSHHPFSPVLGDGQFLPFKSESFDLIAASAALHHIHNLDETLSEIFRCLRPSGQVIFIEPNADHPQRRLIVDGGFLRKYFLQTSDESIFPSDLVSLMNKTGFRTVDFRYMTFRNSHPSFLGRMQYWISLLPWPKSLERFVHSWFVLVGER